MTKGRPITSKWRALYAVTAQGEPLRRRWLLMGTDIGLTLAVLIVIAVLASMLIGYGDDAVMGAAGSSRFFFSGSRTAAVSPQSQPLPPQERAIDHARKHMEPGYRCPQHPEVISAHSGSCPICGERLLWSEGAPPASASLDKEATVVMGARRLKRVALAGAGWVERLLVTEVGREVRQGELLMELYLPELGNGTDRQSGLTSLHAPVAGSVRAIHAGQGNFVASGTVVMQIEDSSSLWLKTGLSADEAVRVRAGQLVEVLQPATMGAVLRGEVDEVVMGRNDQGDATAWLRFDDSPLLRTQAQATVRIHARAGATTP